MTRNGRDRYNHHQQRSFSPQGTSSPTPPPSLHSWTASASRQRQVQNVTAAEDASAMTLQQLRSVAGDTRQSEAERIKSILNLLDSRFPEEVCYGVLDKLAEVCKANNRVQDGDGEINGRRAQAPPTEPEKNLTNALKRLRVADHPRTRQTEMTMLPEEILLAIMRHLDPSSLCRMESVSHRFYAICTEYSQSLWRQRCTITWGIPSTTSDPALPGYFIPRDVDWKTMFEERHNLYTGQNRFRMIADINDLDQRAKRQELVDERRHCYARRPRKYILHCGQPTTAGSGYAVNLRLCGPYMIWISNTNVAVCKVDGHTPHILEGHTASVIALTTNQRNLVVTAAEDATMRIWDLTTLSCIRVMRGVDVLDCATHENILVSYNNDNVIDVWDVETHTRLRKIDVRKFAGVEPSVLTREVKIAVWGDHIVCGFENTVFLIISRLDGTLTHTLSEPRHYHREEFDSTSYPTVLAMYDNILVTRGIRCHEMCVWDLKAGTLLYRLSESISFQATIGHPIRPSEVITDFTLDARGSFLMCTVENEGGDVYLLSWDFRKAWFEDDGWASGAGNAGLATWGNGYTGAWGMGNLGPGGAGGGESEIVAGLWRKRMGVKERRYEKRSLEGVAGEVRFEYTNFWLCYET